MNSLPTSSTDAALLSDRPGEDTTVWRDGTVFRRNRWSGWVQLRDVRPVAENVTRRDPKAA